jgi:hypothetical protein
VSPGSLVEVARTIALAPDGELPAGTIGMVTREVSPTLTAINVPKSIADFGVIVAIADLRPSSPAAWNAQRDAIGLRATEPHFG